MPLMNPENNTPYDINNPHHIFFAIANKTGYVIRAFDCLTMPIPTKEAVKVIPKALITPLTDANIPGIAISIPPSENNKSLYQKLNLLPESTLMFYLKNEHTIKNSTNEQSSHCTHSASHSTLLFTCNPSQRHRERFWWAIILSAPIGLAYLLLHSTNGNSYNNRYPWSKLLDHSILPKNAYEILRNTTAPLPKNS